MKDIMEIADSQPSQQQVISYREVLDLAELQHLQDEFCQVAGVCAYCLDAEGGMLTQVSGGDKELRQYMTEEQAAGLLERVEEGSIEEQAVEEIAPAVKAAAISVRIQGRVIVCWIVWRNVEGEEELHFFHSLDLLRDTSFVLLRDRVSYFSAEAESRRSRFAESEMSRSLRTIEATTQIVQLLDSDEPIEKIMDSLLRTLGEHLQVDSAQVLQLYPDGKTMDVICEWLGLGIVSYFDRAKKVPAYPFLNIEKPLVFSSGDAGQGRLREELAPLGIKALAVFPLIMQENGHSMCLCLNHTAGKHNWSVEEIKFAADAVKVQQSILTRRIQKNSLAGSYEALEAILEHVGCGIYVRNTRTGKVLFANRRLKNTFDRELREGTFNELVDHGIPLGRENGSMEICHAERERWYDLVYTQISWVDGSRASLFSLYDITDKKNYQKRIEQQAYTDFLTGLYNRLCCERDLAWHIDEARKNGETGALLYLDLDDFKHINDGLGHQYGDILLKSISHSLQRVDGIRSTCYRMGGDEFVIVIPPRYYGQFERIVEQIRQIFSRPWYLKDADYYCTMSMGIVTFPDGGDSVADLIKKADIAMYEAKKSGKNRLARYSDSIHSSSGRRLDMEKNMRDATVEGYQEFEVYFQPIIDIHGNQTRCAGAEALIRWNSINLGFISPAEFIPLAEYLGLINPIGNHVLIEACRHCRNWNENGYPDYKVNVNLSVVQLLQADIVNIVERALEETGIRPANLTLEVTESLAINDMDRMKEILNNIKALGVKIALDDFGTGYSSLNHIREIPFDIIKVDQSFVKDLADDAYSQSFIKMVAELAETIGASICVEGIERPDQYKVLQGMKVKYIQGYYFDRPMPRLEFEKKYTPGLVKDMEKV